MKISSRYGEIVVVDDYSLVLQFVFCFFFLMIRRPPRSTLDRSSAASDVYKRQGHRRFARAGVAHEDQVPGDVGVLQARLAAQLVDLSLIHISEPTRPY